MLELSGLVDLTKLLHGIRLLHLARTLLVLISLLHLARRLLILISSLLHRICLLKLHPLRILYPLKILLPLKSLLLLKSLLPLSAHQRSPAYRTE